MPKLKGTSAGNVTIKTVAAVAGVSITTVSRVINSPETVKEETRNKVRKTIDELHYVPDLIARSLGNRRIDHIAVILPNITNPPLAVVVYGILNELEEAGYNILLYDTQENMKKLDRFIGNLPEKLIAGVIIISEYGKPEPLRRLALSVPITMIDCPDCDVPVDKIAVNDVLGIRRLVEYLSDLGHEKIAILTGDLSTSTAKRRKQAFIDSIQNQGLPFRREYIRSCEWTMGGGHNGFRALMKLSSPPSAVICVSDVIATGALGAAYSLKLSVPGDISIAGFDNSPNGAFSVPPLTTLDYPGDLLGRAAARSLIGQIRNGKIGIINEVLPLEVLVRESCGPPGK